MINLYDNLRDKEGNIRQNVTKLFINSTDADGNINEYLSGVAIVPEGAGTMFIVDDWIIPQLDKLKFISGELQLKDGENIEEPQKTEKELEREALLKRLAELETE